MKKILYVTGSRAEYGIMKRLLLKLAADEEIDLRIVATAMQIDERYGNTYKVIEEDGLKIDAFIDIELNNSNNKEVIHSMAVGLDKFGEYLYENQFDAIILLGDRYEILSVAIAAAMQNIPIIHLHGGEITLGNYDEFIRHAITKMSKIHLVATEEYRKRVIQLGENPNSVFNIGALGTENTLSLKLLDRAEVKRRFNLGDKDYFVVLFHPETLTENNTTEQVGELLNALDNYKDKYSFVFIGANSDTGSNIIYDLIREYSEANNCQFLSSTKPEEYLSLIKYSQGLVGNSSSGLIEVPSLKVPTLNIGDRQKGRVRGESVIDVRVNSEEIASGMAKMLAEDFRKQVLQAENPYGGENTLEKAYKIIKDSINSNELYEIKEFYDIK